MNRKFLRHSSAALVMLAVAAASLDPVPFVSSAAGSSVTINEICAKNSVFAAQNGSFYDWIELYNSSSSSVDLSGWGLSDKAAKPYLYTFPQGTSLASGQRITVFCDSDVPDSSDGIAPFGLSTSGETVFLTDKNGSTVDSVQFSSLAENETYGQYPDGSGSFYVLNGSPNSQNTAPQSERIIQAPSFSNDSGFYDSSFRLSIQVPSGTSVYYTTDGSVPDVNSTKYQSPITVSDVSDSPNTLSARTDISPDMVKAPSDNIDKAFIIRAAAIDENGVSSDVVTKTYFVGKPSSNQYYKNMKVISLVTDPDNLFDYENGIYCLGKYYDEWKQSPDSRGKQSWETVANYTQSGKEWERPASFEMFENGQSVLSQDVGIRIKGAASRQAAQKSLNIFARKDYGKDNLKYDFFDGSALDENGDAIKKFDSFTIRNGGNDNSYAFFRDCINQQLVADRDFATQCTNECIVFIDGEYWGMYQITEKINDDFFKNHYGVSKSDVAVIKNGEVEEGTDADLQNWKSVINTYASADMSNDSLYQQFCSKVDVQSFIDYFCAEIYICNDDWLDNNTCIWCAPSADSDNPYADGKWRMFMFDTEYSVGLYGMQNTSASYDSFQNVKSKAAKSDFASLFVSLMNNEEFRQQFALSFMDIANYNFSTDKTNKLIENYLSKYSQQVKDTWTRFGISTSSFGWGMGDWGIGGSWGGPGGSNTGNDKFSNEMNTVKSFYSSRFNSITQSLSRYMNLSGQQKTVTVSNDGSLGTLHLNTITFADNESQWSGKYFTDFPVTFSAEPKSGHTFSHWEISGADVPQSSLYSGTLTVTLTNDITVKAVYDDGKAPLRGDYNSDGAVNISDAVLLQKYLLGQNVTIANTDMVNDGVTDIFDLCMLKKSIIK